MDSKEIKILIIRKNITQAEIARQEGVSPSAVHQTITGRTVSRRLRKAIAERLGLPVEKVWPEEKDKQAA